MDGHDPKCATFRALPQIVKKQFFQKRIKGRGYCDVGTSVISEFYTPLVPKGHDFLQTIGRLAQERQAMPEQQGKEDVIE